MEIKNVIVGDEIARTFVKKHESNKTSDSLATLVYVCEGQDD